MQANFRWGHNSIGKLNKTILPKNKKEGIEMLELKEKIAYLHGLAEGLGIDEASKEGKLLMAMLDVLEEVSSEIEELVVNQDELEEYIEAIDEDLGDIEEDFYGDDEDYCDCCGDDDELDDEDLLGGSYIEVECPKCHEIVRFDAEILEDEDVIEVYCPHCDEIVYVNDDSYIFDEEEFDEEDDKELE